MPLAFRPVVGAETSRRSCTIRPSFVVDDAERKLGGSAEALAPQKLCGIGRKPCATERQSRNQIAGDKITSGTGL